MFLRILTCLTLLFPLHVFSAMYQVANTDALNSITQSLKAGDTVQLLPGEWHAVDLSFKGEGTVDAPITFEAREPGTVVFTGPTAIRLSGSHLVVKDLVFKGAHARDGEDAIFSFRGKDGMPATDSRLTGSLFVDCNPEDPSQRYAWVRLYGTSNRIDRNRFEGMAHEGVTLQVRVTEEDPRHRIDHNHFLNRLPGFKSNGFESLQIGVSQQSLTSARVLVERNLFERCDGETEIISSKTRNNLFRNNVFLESSGTLTLRHGSGSTVENNVFLGRGKPYSGGVRVVDGDHAIRGNVFSGLTGRTGGVVVFYCGIPDSPLNGYFPASNTRLEGNFFIHNTGNSVFLTGGFGRRDRVLKPENLTLQDNVFADIDTGGATALAGHLEDISFSENLYADGVELGAGDQHGFALFHPKLKRHPSGIWEPFDAEASDMSQPLFKAPHMPLRTEVGPPWDLSLPRLHLLDPRALPRIARDPQEAELKAAIMAQAGEIMAKGTRYSVTFNDRIPPSGNRNDYYSTGPYWWPNPETEDGLPYVRRDGEFNPERDRVSDREPLHAMVRDTVWMSLAYTLSGEERYASWGIELLRTWFLKAETRMRPNLNHAQAIPGITEGRDVGIIDAHPFAELVDALRLLQPALAWQAGEREDLHRWFEDYLQWLLHHPNGREERSATNNHGTAYDLQATALLAYLEKPLQLKDYLQAYTLPRIAAQITAEGKQPEELSRTRTWSYCTENLEHFMKIARIAQGVGIDLFHHEAPNGGSLKAALEFLLPYVCEPADWPYPQATAWQEHFMENILAIAQEAYPDLPVAKARRCLKATDNRLKATFLAPWADSDLPFSPPRAAFSTSSLT
jgi:hypothetical protein